MNADWLAGGDRRQLAARAVREAARELLFERGIDRFNVEAVAARAGCSRATLYRVAGGKKALLDAVFAESAAAVAGRVWEGIEGLDGEERVVQAILIALSEIRADPAVEAWVRRTATTDDYLRRSPDLKHLAVALTGSHTAAALAGDWILRVVLALLVWPTEDVENEQELVRDFVAPAFRDGR